MSNHTPEPWVTGRKDMQSYHGDTGEPFSSVYREADDDRMPMGSDGFGGKVRIPLRIAYIEGRDIPRDEEKANADRIVACVNACAGMDDPAATIAGLRAERDGLREAMEKFERRTRQDGDMADIAGNALAAAALAAGQAPTPKTPAQREADSLDRSLDHQQ